jgi:hypothetical protein
MQTNFLLGTLKMSRRARKALQREPFDLIARHAINEHGLVTEKERKNNESAMTTLGELVSRYQVDPTNPRKGTILVKTSASWKVTTVVLESEAA